MPRSATALAALCLVAAAFGPTSASAQSTTTPPGVTTTSSATAPTLPKLTSQVVDTDDVASVLTGTKAPAVVVTEITPPYSTKPVVTVPLAPTSPTTPTTAAGSQPTTTAAKRAASPRKASPTTTTVVVSALSDLAAPPDGGDAKGTIAESVWAALRKCESGGNYKINTGNGYYGAYQFAANTWRRLGYPGLPHEASPAVQDEAARKLQAKVGWGAWPACTRKLGLR
jgi:Transglycosylase-like domain